MLVGKRARTFVLWLPWLLFALVSIWGAMRFLPDWAITYTDPEQHFRHGSTGGERTLGFPYWIWQVLPQVCAHHLPPSAPGSTRPLPYEDAYEAFGMVYTRNAQGVRSDLPVGVSKRRSMGIDRVFLNCAACHISTVRTSEIAEPILVSAMPAQSFDIMAFQNFFFDCAKDPKFTPEILIPAIQGAGADLDFVDRTLVYPLAVYIMRDRVLSLAGRFRFAEEDTPWGPGRVDTFNAAKVLFNIPVHQLPATERNAAADFPSIWLQRAKKEGKFQLHWDGNNDSVEERNLSAAFGTGATPGTIDHDSIARIQNFLLDFAPPPWPYAIDPQMKARGEQLYGSYCADCHGKSGRDFAGEYVGTVNPLAEIGTDPHRLNSYTYALAANQGSLYARDEQHQFRRFRKTNGYANMPLDGLWLRAPYLHNGSVPSLVDLLEPVAARPTVFYRGNDLYDEQRVGFVSNQPHVGSRQMFLFDTSIVGNSNTGHAGPRYGTELPAADKRALIEYLKTF